MLATGAEVHGIDPVAEPGRAASGVTVRVGTVESIPYPDGTFDVVASRSVLEHLKHPEAAFREMRRVLKHDGRMVFLTPSKYDYISVLARLVPDRLHGAIIHSLEGRPEEDVFPTHYRANSAGDIEILAARSGFVVERLTYLNHYPYLLTFSPLLCRAAMAYDRLIQRFRPLHGLQAWLLGCLRKTYASTCLEVRGA